MREKVMMVNDRVWSTKKSHAKYERTGLDETGKRGKK